jgi:phospholipid-binding lipoprotein MlaA
VTATLFRLALLSVITGALLSGCATHAARNPDDPIEPFNRGMFWFNERVDDYVLAPVATGWDKVLPNGVQTSVANFNDNLRFPVNLANDLLQGKLVAASKDVGRFFINSTAGLLGLFDPAKELGMPTHFEDFGQTLGVWGVPPGPYLVAPIWGSMNPRDLVGRFVDTPLSVLPLFVGGLVTLPLTVVDVVNTRSLLLEEVENAKVGAFDYYVFIRDAYGQRRAALINDSTVRREEDIYYYDPDGDAE